MYIIISPAKTFRNSEELWQENCEPLNFSTATTVLVEELRKYSSIGLEKLMKISPALAQINEMRFKEFFEVEKKGCRAIYAYYGEVYKAIGVENLNTSTLEFMQEHVGILSALYGVVKPLESIQPYRLEMSTNLQVGECRNLYAFWKETLTSFVLKELKFQKNSFLINLASEEYSKALDLKEISRHYPIIQISFKEAKENGYRTVGMYAKRGRGQLLRFICENKIETVEEIKRFSEDGYRINEALSTAEHLVFTRG